MLSGKVEHPPDSAVGHPHGKEGVRGKAGEVRGGASVMGGGASVMGGGAVYFSLRSTRSHLTHPLSAAGQRLSDFHR